MDGAVAPKLDVLPEWRARQRRWPVIAPQIAVMFVTLVMVGAIVTLYLRANRTADQLAAIGRDADGQMAVVEAVERNLEDTVSAQRVFLLTQQDDVLESYGRAVAATNDALRAMDEIGAAVAALHDPADAFESAVKDRLAALDRAVAVARAGDRDGVLRTTHETWRSLLRSPRDEAQAMIHDVIAARVARVAAIADHQSQATTAIVSVAMVALLMLGLAASALLTRWNTLVGKEEAVSLGTDRLAATIDNLRDGVAVFDAAERLTLWNGNFFVATGLPTELAVQGTPFGRFVEATAGWPGAPLASPRPVTTPQTARVTSDGRTIELWRAAMPGGGQMLTATDATARVAADATAWQSSKMEALEQLTGEMAHDFNNLLQVVSSNLELLRPLLPPDDLPRRRLSSALASVERAAQLTLHLLAFARRQPLAPDTVDPARLLHGVEELLRRTLGDGISVEVMVHAAIWAVRADPQLLEDAILHLAMNARDAMPKGGRLILSATNVVLDETVTGEHGETVPGEYVLLSVIDDGAGMTPQVLARATEPFFTTKADRRGSGLGLPMVQGFARQSGGKFEVESAPGHGTTARLYIPRRRALPDSLRLAPEAEEAHTQAHGEIVLAVEDDDAVRFSSVQALGSLGYRVIEASDAAAALALLRGGARPDILFTDIVMPGQPSARELAEEARKLHPGIAVLFTSGYIDKGLASQEAASGSFALLSKPWRIGDLGRELRAAVRAARAVPVERPKLQAVLIEDDAMVRMVTADLLSELGYEVTQHASGGDALETLRTSGADLVLIDIGLPDMSGMDVARKVGELAPDAAVVIASGSRDHAEAGFTFLEKPYDATRLRRAVGRARATQG
jgi:signal transduction histidine kinase/CheY-like chemotaxis protein